MKKENNSLEYKEKVTKSYLKTVSAFSNYRDGEIIFGITDEYKIVGIDDPKTVCLNIENQINDSIKPKPNYLIRINDDGTISLLVKKGLSTPYRYNGKCYIRNDSSTIEADTIQENRLVLEGINKRYEELPSNNQKLTFDVLSKEITQHLKLSSFNTDTMKSLGLYNEIDHYNNAALLLADNNDCAGLDIVVYGETNNEFRKRITLSGVSLITQYRKSLEFFLEEYTVERIENGFRNNIELIPIDAFREAIANSIIHRVWDVHANTKVEMYKDKVIISSPGGLLPEMQENEFLKGSYSYLRNPILANVFHRLDIVEIFATGIRRINEAYEAKTLKPIFDINSNSISIMLPVNRDVKLSLNERKLYQLVNGNIYYSRKDLENLSNLSKDTIIRCLNSLISKGLIIKEGKGKGTVYYKTLL